jgi:hypothetical protein
MSTGFQIIEGVEDDGELRKPCDVECGVLDVRMISLKFDVRIESLRRFLRDQSLRLLDVLVTEKELAIEVAKIDCVKVDDVDFAEACEYQVLQQLAADAASANE